MSTEIKEGKLSDLQIKVLKVLAEHYDADANCLYIRYIAKEAKVEYRLARLAVRALARKGFAEYVRGLMDDEGMAAGSGYVCTHEGALLVNKCKNPVCRNLISMITGECQSCWEKRRIYEFTDDWGLYKKGEKIKPNALSERVFKDLYWGTEENSFNDKILKDCTPDEYEYEKI